MEGVALFSFLGFEKYGRGKGNLDIHSINPTFGGFFN